MLRAWSINTSTDKLGLVNNLPKPEGPARGIRDCEFNSHSFGFNEVFQSQSSHHSQYVVVQASLRTPPRPRHYGFCCPYRVRSELPEVVPGSGLPSLEPMRLNSTYL